jgi:hypothetical protein
MAVAAAAFGALTDPGLELLGTGEKWGLWLGPFMMIVPTTALWGGYSAAEVELFSARNRQAAFSITYNVGVAVLGGTVGLIATALVAGVGVALGPTVHVAALSVLTLVVLAVIPETAHVPPRTAAPQREDEVA